MGFEEVHLVAQNSAALQVDVFGVGGYEGNGQQLHAGLFGGATGFVIVAAFAGGDDVVPVVSPFLADGGNVITREIAISETVATVQTQVVIAAEQGLIAQGRNVVGLMTGFGDAALMGGNDGIDFDQAA